ncbi:hypothetical protein GCK72_001844 [Caenorhabditis remanei]|uniref:Uncharacterized protein n=1 Tax=Caenorhabditis remanei TaxID=31234 RepID=A0A6A5HUR2_CAERE|nr:hypothetical protein GCK72_001844 [Caenorhabditis remanei]KAF1770027.1 hypothetical protein GCK72_001844 [Caenorhabditis remanei]
MAVIRNHLESMSDVAGGVTMDFYGYGTQPAFNEPESSSSLAEFQYEQTWVIQPQFVFRSKTPKSGKYSEEQLILARSTSEKSVACAHHAEECCARQLR